MASPLQYLKVTMLIRWILIATWLTAPICHSVERESTASTCEAALDTADAKLEALIRLEEKAEEKFAILAADGKDQEIAALRAEFSVKADKIMSTGLRESKRLFSALAEQVRAYAPEMPTTNPPPGPQFLVSEAKYLLANWPYQIVRDRPGNRHIQHVQFNQDVVDHLKGLSRHTPQQYLAAIKKGFVAEDGETGLKRVKGKMVEVKLMGHGKNERILGCYENGVIDFVRVIQKTNDQVRAERYSFCD